MTTRKLLRHTTCAVLWLLWQQWDAAAAAATTAAATTTTGADCRRRTFRLDSFRAVGPQRQRLAVVDPVRVNVTAFPDAARAREVRSRVACSFLNSDAGGTGAGYEATIRKEGLKYAQQSFPLEDAIRAFRKLDANGAWRLSVLSDRPALCSWSLTITACGGTEEDDNLLGSDPPSDVPSMVPSGAPSMKVLSDGWVQAPSVAPSDSPSTTPSMVPSGVPSSTPSMRPSGAPSSMPSMAPSDTPSNVPSMAPSDSPSGVPTQKASDAPSSAPSDSPSTTPSQAPSQPLSGSPSVIFTADGETVAPSGAPSRAPTRHHRSPRPSAAPSDAPSPLPTPPPTPYAFDDDIWQVAGITSAAAAPWMERLRLPFVVAMVLAGVMI